MRIKVPLPTVPVPATREEAVGIVREITELLLEERMAKAEMDVEITALKEAYDARLSSISARLGQVMPAIEGWAETNRGDFAGKKSIDLHHGIVGWRITPPTLKPVKGYTWSSVLDRIRDRASEFIRTKEEVDKEKLLAARDNYDLKALGCQVVQVDEFYVEPKITKTEDRAKAA
jgi:phage host-nuclease inhibitor protein Gam